MKRIVAGVLTGALALAGTDLSASIFAEQTLHCPVGGKTFTAQVQVSSSSFGQRPDGKPYSTNLAPPPECPDNGFVFYKEDYTAAEQAKLTRLVLSPQFRKLRSEENIFYRRYWILTQMGEPAVRIAEELLVAGWNSDEVPAAKSRYQREFVRLVAALPSDTKHLFWLRARAADILRQLGEHRDAEVAIARLEAELPTVADEKERGQWKQFLKGQRTLVRERNASSEPVTLVPTMVAAELCADAARPFTPSEQERCASPELSKNIEDYRAFNKRFPRPPKR